MLYDIVLVLFFRILQTPQHYNVDKQQRFVNIDTSFTQKRSVMEKVIFSWHQHPTKHNMLLFSYNRLLISLRFINIGY
jgi:hypothetical protein